MLSEMKLSWILFYFCRSATIDVAGVLMEWIACLLVSV
jgi:hypothetical protein